MMYDASRHTQSISDLDEDTGEHIHQPEVREEDETRKVERVAAAAGKKSQQGTPTARHHPPSEAAVSQYTRPADGEEEEQKKAQPRQPLRTCPSRT